jgi:hypothetical protein
MDYEKLKKPPRIKEEIWRQHLAWMEVIGKQLRENTEKRRKRAVSDSEAAKADIVRRGA